MRTTIEIKDEHRARLLEIAARRGEKGFSGLVAQALEEYLKNQNALQDASRQALALRGRLAAEDAEQLRAATSELRRSWR